MSEASKESDNLCLLVRHLPREFSETDKLDFLKHFGAVSIKTVSVGGKKNEVVFATFPSPSIAKAALVSLHQLDVLGHHLCVEYACKSRHSSSDITTGVGEKRFEVKPEEDKRQRLQDQLIRRLVAWSSKLNLSQPPPSHLRYQYPPPCPATLANISKALAANPKLYTQLLHLMNRMNLPPPFEDPGNHKNSCSQSTQTDVVWVNKSSSESEIESEEESASTSQNGSQMKRPLALKRKKPLKRPRFIKPTPQAEQTGTASVTLKPEEVFEKADPEAVPKKIEFRLGTSLSVEKGDSEIELQTDTLEHSGFGVMLPTSKDSEKNDQVASEETTKGDEGDGSFITSEQLASNRIPPKDLKVLPVFKNYDPGTPSCRLYVKNVSKHAITRDLHFIYRRYLNLSQDHNDGSIAEMFDVRLMTEGRMKGQAFITLPSVGLAQQALKETNGYILKDKPLVVQFARSAPASGTSKQIV